MGNFNDNLAGLVKPDEIEAITIFEDGKVLGRIPNAEGKRGSLAVYAHLLGFEDGIIGQDEAKKGLELFAEHTSDALQNPGKHPNVDLLLDVQRNSHSVRGRIDFKVPGDLKEI